MKVPAHLLLLCVLAAFQGCASSTDRALDLGEAGAAAVFPDRIELLSGMALDASARPAARFAAVRSLAHIGGPDAVGPLAAVSHAAASSPLRKWAAWGLGETGVPEAVPELAALAIKGPDGSVAEQALQGLARLSAFVRGDPASRLAALRAANAAECRTGASSRARGLAALLREDLGNLRDFAALLEESARGGDIAEAYNALGWTGDLLLERPDVEPAARERALGAVVSLVDGEDAALRLRALWYLGRIGDPGTAAALVRTARTHPDRATRLLAVWALWRADRGLFEETFKPMPPDLLSVTPANWREARDKAAALGEPDLEIQRLIADLLRERGR